MTGNPQLSEAVKAIASVIEDVTPEEEEIIRKINRRMREAGISPYREIVNLGNGRKTNIVDAGDVKSALVSPPGAGWCNGMWCCAECGAAVHDGACDKENIRTWSESDWRKRREDRD